MMIPRNFLKKKKVTKYGVSNSLKMSMMIECEKSLVALNCVIRLHSASAVHDLLPINFKL